MQQKTNPAKSDKEINKINEFSSFFEENFGRKIMFRNLSEQCEFFNFIYIAVNLCERYILFIFIF